MYQEREEKEGRGKYIRGGWRKEGVSVSGEGGGRGKCIREG